MLCSQYEVILAPHKKNRTRLKVDMAADRRIPNQTFRLLDYSTILLQLHREKPPVSSVLLLFPATVYNTVIYPPHGMIFDKNKELNS